MHSHYENLKVARNASQSEIKKAYRKLCSEHHPDRNKDPDATHRMQIINEAWAVLSNPAKRKKHDAEIKRKEELEAFIHEMEEKAQEEPKKPEPYEFEVDPDLHTEYVYTGGWKDPEDVQELKNAQVYFEASGSLWESESIASLTYSKVDPTYRVYRTDFKVGEKLYYYYACYKSEIKKKWARVYKELGVRAKKYSSDTLSPRLANEELMSAMLANRGVLWSEGEPKGDVTAAFFRKG